MTTAIECHTRDTIYSYVPEGDKTTLSNVAASLATARALMDQEKRLTELYNPLIYKSTGYMLSELSSFFAGRSMTDRRAQINQLGKKLPDNGDIADLRPTFFRGDYMPILRAKELEVATVGLYLTAAGGARLEAAEAVDVITSQYLSDLWIRSMHDPTDAYTMIDGTLNINPEIRSLDPTLMHGAAQRSTIVLSYAGTPRS